MKKLTALLMGTAMVLSLAACGGSASSAASSEAASSEAASSEETSEAAAEETTDEAAGEVTTVNAGKLTKSVFYAWSEEARKKKEDCDSGVISPEEFSRWLKES